MVASITDKFGKASNGTRAEATTLTAQKGLGASSISTAALNGWDTTAAVHFQIYRTDTSNNIIAGSQSDWKGVVTGTTISQLVLEGGSDSIYPIGSVVICLPSAGWADDLVEGILTHANQNGTLLPSAVTTALNTAPAGTTQIADNSITTAKIVDNNVTASKLSTSAIFLGYSQITADFSTGSTTPVQVTGLTSTVTIPSGGRRIKITFQCRDAFRTGGGPFNITLWDGVVGSGTQIQAIQPNTPNGNAQSGTLTWVSPTAPAAGSKTYNIGLSGATGTMTIEAGATYPAFILVETI